MHEAIRELLAALGPDLVLTDEADRISYSYDATHLSHRPDVVVFPRTTEHVQKVMAMARRHRVPVFPRGSGTGLSGGAIPLGGIALVMTRMNRILEIDPATCWRGSSPAC
jgi:FAD/FMN-containing dehydrogenases